MDRYYIFVLQRSTVRSGVSRWSIQGIRLNRQPEQPAQDVYDASLLDENTYSRAKRVWENALGPPEIQWEYEWMEHGRYGPLNQQNWMQLVLDSFDSIHDILDPTMKKHLTDVGGGSNYLQVCNFLQELKDKHNLFPTIHGWNRDLVIDEVMVPWQELHQIQFYLDVDNPRKTIPSRQAQDYRLNTPMHVSIFLVTAMGLIIPRSFTLAVVDGYALTFGCPIRQPGILLVIVMGDWVLSVLSLAAACATAGVVNLLPGIPFNEGSLCPPKVCSRYQLSAIMAFLAWFLTTASSLINLLATPFLANPISS